MCWYRRWCNPVPVSTRATRFRLEGKVARIYPAQNAVVDFLLQPDLEAKMTDRMIVAWE